MEQHSKNQQEQQIELLKTLSPEEVLFDCIRQKTPHWTDLNKIEMAKEYGELPDPVINVLILYVMINMEVETLNAIFSEIAIDWSKKNIKTVEEAMALAKQENTKYKKWNEQHYEDTRAGVVLRGAIKRGITDKQLGQIARLFLK